MKHFVGWPIVVKLLVFFKGVSLVIPYLRRLLYLLSFLCLSCRLLFLLLLLFQSLLSDTLFLRSQYFNVLAIAAPAIITTIIVSLFSSSNDIFSNVIIWIVFKFKYFFLFLFSLYFNNFPVLNWGFRLHLFIWWCVVSLTFTWRLLSSFH